MEAVSFIKDVKEFLLENFEELSDLIGDIKGVSFIRKTLNSRQINGGIDEWEEEQVIAVSSNGWVKCIIEAESKFVANLSGFHTNKFDMVTMTDDQVEDYLNSKECSIGEVKQFIDKYNKIAKDQKGLREINPFLDYK
ncbi:hypothetical protein M3689_05675 [Alkalihalophilus marmarensis]|uniref:hypothetical protein n=1 Tax=Alkalihalophilus marmarensis TaxID=521377 RepID=UPI00203A778D|nr:hypothetical protein [Alkalihalophilus marmarensis]MCM3488795.1 hypothetical protein [Alkalihalophilus marmarensis]